MFVSNKIIPSLLFFCSWRVAAVSWSIKHVCIHTQGASLHADFAHSRNKFRGPSVREVGVIFLPPQFHTEAINWSLSQKEQSRLTRQYTCSCSIQQKDYCLSGAFYLDIILSVLKAEVPDVISCYVLSPRDAPSSPKKACNIHTKKDGGFSMCEGEPVFQHRFSSYSIWPTVLISKQKNHP